MQPLNPPFQNFQTNSQTITTIKLTFCKMSKTYIGFLCY